MAGHKKVLVVLDFDWSLVEENSDTWVLQQLGATDIFNQLLAEGRSWTRLMDEALLRTHTELGAGKNRVLQAIHSTPFHQDMMQAVQHLAAVPGCDLIILSDANTIFITEILKHYNLAQHIRQVYSNAGVWQDGALRVRPFHDEKSPHGCPRCPPNLCKGQVLDSIKADAPYVRVAYLGDGSGDFCPCMRLQSSDYIIARECYPTGAECPLFKKVRLAGATIANCFDPASSSKEAVSSAPARTAPVEESASSCQLQDLLTQSRDSLSCCSPLQAGQKGRRMKAMSDWGLVGRASSAEQDSEVAAAVCPWRNPPEAAALLQAIVKDAATAGS